MKRIVLFISLLSVVCIFFSGCECEHVWRDANCVEPRKCEICGMTSGVTLGHQWVEADCKNPKTCSVCGSKEGELGHSVAIWNVAKESTCLQAGTEVGVCTVCDATVERPAELGNHTPGDWIVTAAPTASKRGLRVKKCTVCGTEIESENFELSRKEYESLCEEIQYDKLSRTPDTYEGSYVEISGYVVQVVSEASSSQEYSIYRVATSNHYDDVVLLKVNNYGTNARILEDDYITVYGEYTGLYTYKTVMGSTMTIPSVKGRYITITER